jgi:hypothetical protein
VLPEAKLFHIVSFSIAGAPVRGLRHMMTGRVGLGAGRPLLVSSGEIPLRCSRVASVDRQNGDRGHFGIQILVERDLILISLEVRAKLK